MRHYRIDPNAPDGGYASHFTIKAAIEWGLLIEVDPCMHGNYARHLVDRWFEINRGYTDDWCLGAGLEAVSVES